MTSRRADDGAERVQLGNSGTNNPVNSLASTPTGEQEPTPGEWRIHWSMGDGDFHWIVRDDQPEFRIAKVEVFAPTDGDMEAEGVANARLIAAAPALLKAAEALLTSIDQMDPEQAHCSTVAYSDLQQAVAQALPLYSRPQEPR